MRGKIIQTFLSVISVNQSFSNQFTVTFQNVETNSSYLQLRSWIEVDWYDEMPEYLSDYVIASGYFPLATLLINERGTQFDFNELSVTEVESKNGKFKLVVNNQTGGLQIVKLDNNENEENATKGEYQARRQKRDLNSENAILKQSEKAISVEKEVITTGEDLLVDDVEVSHERVQEEQSGIDLHRSKRESSPGISTDPPDGADPPGAQTQKNNSKNGG